MECLAHCYRGLYFCIVYAIASLTPCLTQVSSHMEAKYGYAPRRGSDAADQIAVSLSPHPGIPKLLPQSHIASKLDVDHEIWVSSGVLDWLDRRKGNE